VRSRLGLLQPLLVDDRLHLLDGWTRYRALKSAHIKKVLVTRRSVKSEQEGLRVALAANSFARQLNFLELGRVANHLLNSVRVGSGRNRLRVEIAREIGKTEAYVAQAVATERQLHPEARKILSKLCSAGLLGPKALMAIHRIPSEQQLSLARQLAGLKNEAQIDQYVDATLSVYEDSLATLPVPAKTQSSNQSGNSPANETREVPAARSTSLTEKRESTTPQDPAKTEEQKHEQEKQPHVEEERYIKLYSLDIQGPVDKVDRWALWIRDEKQNRRLNVFRELHAAKLKMRPGDIVTLTLRVEGPLRRDFRAEQRKVILQEIELMLQEANGGSAEFTPKLLHDRLRKKLREEQLPEAFDKAFSVTKIGNRLSELGLKRKGAYSEGSIYVIKSQHDLRSLSQIPESQKQS